MGLCSRKGQVPNSVISIVSFCSIARVPFRTARVQSLEEKKPENDIVLKICYDQQTCRGVAMVKDLVQVIMADFKFPFTRILLSSTFSL